MANIVGNILVSFYVPSELGIGHEKIFSVSTQKTRAEIVIAMKNYNSRRGKGTAEAYTFRVTPANPETGAPEKLDLFFSDKFSEACRKLKIGCGGGRDCGPTITNLACQFWALTNLVNALDPAMFAAAAANGRAK